MKCPSCQSEIRESTNFCEQCGAGLEHECPKCKAKMPLASKFCGQCGQDLKGPEQAPSIDYDQPDLSPPNSLQKKSSPTGVSWKAREQWGRAAKIVHTSANALSHRSLREGFLKSRPIREILSRAEHCPLLTKL